MSQRETIFVEEATIISHKSYEGDQYILRVQAPEIALHAEPGSFAHIRCDNSLLMRRPLSIMLVNPKTAEVDFLYKVVGEGTQRLAERKIGETLNIIGPIGNPFVAHNNRPRTLLIGGGVGIPPMVFLANRLKADNEIYKPFVIMGSEVPFPFTLTPSRILVTGMPEGVIASMPLMEDWDIPSRLASLQNYPGCFQGYVTDLARAWLQTLNQNQRDEIEIFACGPHPMLQAVANLAKEFKLPCQVSLEEFMACAVGGCAGCTVAIKTDTGPAMKRVCVDGPVFDAYSVFS